MCSDKDSERHWWKKHRNPDLRHRNMVMVCVLFIDFPSLCLASLYWTWEWLVTLTPGSQDFCKAETCEELF